MSQPQGHESSRADFGSLAEAVLIIAAAVASLIFKTPQENDTEAEETEDENSVESSGTNEEEQS